MYAQPRLLVQSSQDEMYMQMRSYSMYTRPGSYVQAAHDEVESIGDGIESIGDGH